jgi:hypothetical protein
MIDGEVLDRVRRTSYTRRRVRWNPASSPEFVESGLRNRTAGRELQDDLTHEVENAPLTVGTVKDG